MRKPCIAVLAVFAATAAHAQQTKVSLKDLAVPNSPAFVLTDITPTVVQAPSTPKEFALNVAQSFQQGDGFPQNYSAEFTPYWWINPDTKSFYSVVGLQKTTSGYREQATSGLKTTGVSLAFINKDLIDDGVDKAHKTAALGFRTTLLRKHSTSWATTLAGKVNAWQRAVQADLDSLSFGTKTPEQVANNRDALTTTLVSAVRDILKQKPVFEWNLAGAYASYGIGDTAWRAGRWGLWSDMSLNLPLAGDDGKRSANYVHFNFIGRYLRDNYYHSAKDLPGVLSETDNFDIGGRVGISFSNFSFGYEFLQRANSRDDGSQSRSVGTIAYQLGENLYLNGGFGRNFSGSGRLISFLGVRWGLGNEKVNLPSPGAQ